MFRRLDDDFCDPVELRVDSALGVPGLLGAIRKGSVVGRERARQRGDGIRRLARVPARARRVADRRAPDAALGRDLVVRGAARARVGDRAAPAPGDQADLPRSEPRARVRPRPLPRGSRPADRAHARIAARLRRPGASGLLAGARLVHQELRRLLGARARHPRLCHRDAGGLSGDARRPRAVRRRRPRGNRVDAAGRRQQGHLGAVRFERGLGGVHRADRPGGPARDRAPPGSALDAGGESVLDGTLRRALRGQDAAPARDARPAAQSPLLGAGGRDLQGVRRRDGVRSREAVHLERRHRPSRRMRRSGAKLAFGRELAGGHGTAARISAARKRRAAMPARRSTGSSCRWCRWRGSRSTT